jgi:hypothetical protein
MSDKSVFAIRGTRNGVRTIEGNSRRRAYAAEVSEVIGKSNA